MSQDDKSMDLSMIIGTLTALDSLVRDIEDLLRLEFYRRSQTEKINKLEALILMTPDDEPLVEGDVLSGCAPFDAASTMTSELMAKLSPEARRFVQNNLPSVFLDPECVFEPFAVAYSEADEHFVFVRPDTQALLAELEGYYGDY